VTLTNVTGDKDQKDLRAAEAADELALTLVE
jgi:hypothetical protein